MGQAIPTPKAIVLVVEDEPILRMMAVDTVEEAGFEVIETASAEDAVRILESRTDIGIVFTDIDMPNGMDGMKLAAAIRDRWPPIEIIITSGKSAPRPENMPARGVFFAKPYRRDEITTALRRMAQ